jgi:hypothetical protein
MQRFERPLLTEVSFGAPEGLRRVGYGGSTIDGAAMAAAFPELTHATLSGRPRLSIADIGHWLTAVGLGLMVAFDRRKKRS